MGVVVPRVVVKVDKCCRVHVAYVRLCSCCRVRNSPALFLVESSKNNFLKKKRFLLGVALFWAWHFF